ncbi:hypothetical protein [Duganella sp.]|uniref:hypothetical protein n=1 Tax=Duganella sp. TaxID=1904440 RepID=UPI0031DE5013
MNKLLLAALLAAAPVHATEWIGFGWASFGDFPHAAVILPATVNGKACFVQLDTGANGGFIPAGQAAGAPVDIVIGQHAIRASVPPALPAGDQCHAGTVGNSFFDNGTLTLDLRHARFAYRDAAMLRDDSEAAPFRYVQHEGCGGGHIVVPVTLPGQPPQEAMFDTGAALFSFAPLQLSMYDALRGADSKPLKAPSWGSEVDCQTSRLTAPLRVSRYTLDGGVLGHCKLGVDIGVPLAGIVGLAGFAGQTIIIDYPSRKWKITR